MKLFSQSIGGTIGQELYMTIESSLKGGCGLSHESAQDSYNSTRKTHLKWNYGTFRVSIYLKVTSIEAFNFKPPY